MSIGGEHDIPKADNRAEGGFPEGRDLEKCGSREGPQESGKPVPRRIY